MEVMKNFLQQLFMDFSEEAQWKKQDFFRIIMELILFL